MPPRIKTIDVRAFRGIPHLQIPLEGKNLLLRGENGTGKSSIVEAFEFFFTGTVSHLEGTQGISPGRHAPHVNYTEDDVAVELAFDPGDVHLTRTFSSAPNPPQHLAPYIASASRGAFILKRSQILQFIASRPADRFRALASIIGVESLDEIELEIMRARDDLAGELEASEAEVASLRAALSRDLDAPVSAIGDVLPALNSLLGQAKLPPIASLRDIQPHAVSMLKSVKSVAGVETVSILTASVTQAQAPLFSKAVIDQSRQLGETIKPHLDKKVQLELKLSDLLRIGASLIDQEHLDTCPLCQQPIETAALLAAINKRILTLQALSENAATARKLASSLTTTIGAAHARVSALQAAIGKHKDLRISSLPKVATSPIFGTAPRQIAEAAALQLDFSGEEFQAAITQTEANWQQVALELEAQIAKLGVTDEEKRLLEMVRLVGAVNDKVDRLGIAQENAGRLLQMKSHAQVIFQAFSDAKRSKVAEIYNTIEADIRRYYSIIHPGEEHTDITLRLRAGQRASTELRMKSFGRDDEDPRALTSEGHLDSLGLCIFLAFVKSFNVDCNLVLLDDVVTTIDSGHRRKVCDLLLGDFADCQMVVTTHDGIWYKEFAAAQRAYGREGSFLNLEILSWSLESGPGIERFLPRTDLIERRIQSNDKTGAGNESRQYLEWLLKHTAIHTNASVPAANWLSGMVGDLAPSVRARLTQLAADPGYSTQLAAAFSDLERTTIFGNLTSHDNILADQLSMAEVQAFYLAVRNLHALVSCATCATHLEYVKTTREYRCVNPRCTAPRVWPTK